MRVIADMIFCSRGPNLSSELISETTERKSNSWRRDFSMASMVRKLSSETEACEMIASRRDRSPSVNCPSILFNSCETPMISPFKVRKGAQRMVRVLNPVCWSMARLKRSSA